MCKKVFIYTVLYVRRSDHTCIYELVGALKALVNSDVICVEGKDKVGGVGDYGTGEGV